MSLQKVCANRHSALVLGRLCKDLGDYYYDSYYASAAFPAGPPPRLVPPLKRPRLMVPPPPPPGPPLSAPAAAAPRPLPTLSAAAKLTASALAAAAAAAANSGAAVGGHHHPKGTTTISAPMHQLKSYSNPDILICGNCREMFTELQELLDHKRTYCKLRFTCKCHTLNGVKSKGSDHGAESGAALLCMLCKDSFSSAWDLMVHVQAAHMLNIYELGVPKRRSASSVAGSPGGGAAVGGGGANGGGGGGPEARGGGPDDEDETENGLCGGHDDDPKAEDVRRRNGGEPKEESDSECGTPSTPMDAGSPALGEVVGVSVGEEDEEERASSRGEEEGGVEEEEMIAEMMVNPKITTAILEASSQSILRMVGPSLSNHTPSAGSAMDGAAGGGVPNGEVGVGQ
ncbi:zinc finger protein 296-like [Hetaerina americana]|uniref:zinc finger protein 296-like n=1 Tax=Hetaerina americana TaxID=62018 RepID=UPI003A7F1A0E